MNFLNVHVTNTMLQQGQGGFMSNLSTEQFHQDVKNNLATADAAFFRGFPSLLKLYIVESCL